MALSDARERFTRAAGILADEAGRIKDRLLIAYASQLSLINAKQDLPPELIEQFYAIQIALSDAEMAFGYGEHAAKKLSMMDESEASALARRIFSLFLKLCGLNSVE